MVECRMYSRDTRVDQREGQFSNFFRPPHEIYHQNSLGPFFHIMIFFPPPIWPNRGHFSNLFEALIIAFSSFQIGFFYGALHQIKFIIYKVWGGCIPGDAMVASPRELFKLLPTSFMWYIVGNHCDHVFILYKVCVPLPTFHLRVGAVC